MDEIEVVLGVSAAAFGVVGGGGLWLAGFEHVSGFIIIDYEHTVNVCSYLLGTAALLGLGAWCIGRSQ